MSAMVYFSSVQHFGGRYRCKSFTVVFGDGKEGGPTAPDESWQGAYISTSVLGEQRLLMYSHFNGIYEEEGELLDSLLLGLAALKLLLTEYLSCEGSQGGRPRYVERNKIDGKPFKDITPAEIVYCVDIKAWVFRHEQIRTADDYDNEVIDVYFFDDSLPSNRSNLVSLLHLFFFPSESLLLVVEIT